MDTDDRMNKGYVHLAILNIFPLFQDTKENMHTKRKKFKMFKKANLNF